MFGNNVEESIGGDWLRTLLPRRRQGWIVAGTSLGLRWIAVRRGSIKPPTDPIRRGQGCSVQSPAVRGSSDGKGCGRHHT
ncbi:hypothetical protein GS485_17550 [Rhodococcus hoagii]|nr:hypothetical protein [Prescottella equi]